MLQGPISDQWVNCHKKRKAQTKNFVEVTLSLKISVGGFFSILGQGPLQTPFSRQNLYLCSIQIKGVGKSELCRWYLNKSCVQILSEIKRLLYTFWNKTPKGLVVISLAEFENDSSILPIHLLHSSTSARPLLTSIVRHTWSLVCLCKSHDHLSIIKKIAP